MSRSPVFVGCDLGTTGSKAAVVDESGTLLGEAHQEVPLSRPRPGWVEQDPLVIEASAHAVIGRALAVSGRAADVAAVAFSGQMSGIGAVDAELRPVTRYDSWLDTRCEPYIERMSEAAGRVVELAGCPPTYAHGPKILWWREQEPETFARIHRFVPIGSFVAARAAGLTGDEAFVDHTHLHFSNLADTRAGTWSAELLEAFGVPPEVLPRIVAPTEVVGEVTRATAEATGLPAGTPVAAGAGDTTAASLGAGAVLPGRAFDVAGTASVLAICLDDFHPDQERHTLMATRGIVPGTFLNLAFINGGGLAPPWFAGEVAGLEELEAPAAYDLLEALAAEVPPGSDGLLWYPHVQGRVLPPSPHARGAWVGLTAQHGRGHLYRAILEGVAFEYAEWARLAAAAGGGALTEARALGGGAASGLWNQIKADVLGIDWVPTVVPEAGVLGDALVAAAATGHAPDMVATIESWQSTREPVRPRPEAHEVYGRLQPAHRAMGDALDSVFDMIEGAR
ncbi:xylulokinase [Georgenia alba]|uniref:FGGY-family carbohydrate kinase n=1 Tax=Georgenia alba TaxID=2233858 RepID=A0ABW2Q3P1_9MICO